MTETVTIMDVVPLFFYTMLFDPLQMYRSYHNFGGHVDGWQAHAKLKCLFGNPMSNNFCKTAVNFENISFTSKNCKLKLHTNGLY